MKKQIVLTDEQANALAHWALSQHLEHGTSGWGKAFDDAMAVAESVRGQLQRDAVIEKIVKDLSFSVSESSCDNTFYFTAYCNERPQITCSANTRTDAINNCVKLVIDILQQEWPLRNSIEYFNGYLD